MLGEKLRVQVQHNDMIVTHNEEPMIHTQRSTVAESVPYDCYTLEHSCQISPRPVKHYACTDL